MLPAHAGMILWRGDRWEDAINVTRTRGDDPRNDTLCRSILFMLPAHAGMILRETAANMGIVNVTRTRGDDPNCFCIP